MIQDKRHQSDPGFQNAGSRIYRLEYGVMTIAIVVFIAWRCIYVSGSINILEIVLWAIIPDLVVFVPIGLASKRGKWPSWGATLYNFFHTIIIWIAAFVVSWVVLKTPHWELLGWLGHIMTDRAVGFGLREKRIASLNHVDLR